MRIYSVNRGDRMLVRFKILWSQAVSTKHDRRCTDELDLLRSFNSRPSESMRTKHRHMGCLRRQWGPMAVIDYAAHSRHPVSSRSTSRQPLVRPDAPSATPPCADSELATHSALHLRTLRRDQIRSDTGCTTAELILLYSVPPGINVLRP